MKNFNTKEINNKIVVITGSSGEVGKILVKKFSKFKCKLILIDIKKVPLKKLPNGSKFYKCDLSSLRQTKELIDKLNFDYKKIDILINNAAATGDMIISKNYKKIITEDWEKIFRVNLFSIFQLIYGLKEKLLKSNYPSVINVSSVYGEKVPDFEIYLDTKIYNPPEYSLSKSALNYLTKWTSKNLHKKIRVNSISLGGIFRNQNIKFVKKYVKRTKIKRMATEEDLVNAIIFLISKQSSYITGHNLIVDGGFTN